MSELTKKSFMNLLTSVFKSGCLMALTFIVTPLLLKYIGPTYFGTFKVLMETYGTLSLLEMGLFASFVSLLIPVIKKGDQDELDELLSEGKRRFRVVMVLTALFGLAFFPFLRRLTSWPYQDATELYMTWALLLSTTPLIPFLIYKAFLEAGNQGHKINLIFLFQNMCYLLIGLIFAWFGWELKAQAVGGFISGLIGVLLLRYYSGFKVAHKKGKSARFHNLLSRNQKPQIINEIAAKISLNCDQMIIAFFIGPMMVTKVFLGQRVVMIVQSQLQAFGQSSWASLGSLYYERDKNPGLFEKRMMEMNKFLATLAVATLVPTCLLNRAFIELWVGKDLLMETDALVYLASGNAFFWSLFSFWGLLFAVLGKPQVLTKMVWGQALINVTASLLLTNTLGGVGPIAGTLLSNLLVPLWCFPILLKQNFDLPYRSTVNALVWPGIVGVLSVMGYAFSPWKIHDLTWLSFFAWGVVIFSFYVCLLFLVLFNREEKEIFIKRANGLITKFRNRAG